MGNRLWTTFGWLVPSLFLMGATALLAQERVFKMQKVSVFDEKQDLKTRQQLQGGQYARCNNIKKKAVKAYPKLKSKNPLYGAVKFGGSPIDSSAGVEYQFVIDASGEVKKEKEKEKGKGKGKKKSSARLGTFSASSANVPKYDLLYFDANRDLDLTNDPVIKLMKDPPPGAITRQGPGGGACIFNYLDLKFDLGPKLGKQPLRMMPRLWAPNPRYAYMTFVPAIAWKGEIQIGKQEYKALLTQASAISGRFDAPFTQLYLTAVDNAEKQRSGWGSQWLCVVRQRDGELYDVSASPTGDKITVRPYGGDVGVFEVGPGNRDVKKLGASGVLISDKPVLVNLGKSTSRYSTKKDQQCNLPAGNYMPLNLSVDYGNVTVSLSPNFYGCDGSTTRSTKPTYPFKVRKGKSCVLDFSDKPVVSFLSPSNKATYKPGSTVRFAAFLADPEFNLMIRGLTDTSKTERELKFKDDKGKEIVIPRYVTLHPSIVVTDSSGKEVAKGKMPFG